MNNNNCFKGFLTEIEEVVNSPLIKNAIGTGCVNDNNPGVLLQQSNGRNFSWSPFYGNKANNTAISGASSREFWSFVNQIATEMASQGVEVTTVRSFVEHKEGEILTKYLNHEKTDVFSKLYKSGRKAQEFSNEVNDSIDIGGVFVDRGVRHFANHLLCEISSGSEAETIDLFLKSVIEKCLDLSIMMHGKDLSLEKIIITLEEFQGQQDIKNKNIDIAINNLNSYCKSKEYKDYFQGRDLFISENGLTSLHFFDSESKIIFSLFLLQYWINMRNRQYDGCRLKRMLILSESWRYCDDALRGDILRKSNKHGLAIVLPDHTYSEFIRYEEILKWKVFFRTVNSERQLISDEVSGLIPLVKDLSDKEFILKSDNVLLKCNFIKELQKIESHEIFDFYRNENAKSRKRMTIFEKNKELESSIKIAAFVSLLWCVGDKAPLSFLEALSLTGLMTILIRSARRIIYRRRKIFNLGLQEQVYLTGDFDDMFTALYQAGLQLKEKIGEYYIFTTNYSLFPSDNFVVKDARGYCILQGKKSLIRHLKEQINLKNLMS